MIHSIAFTLILFCYSFESTWRDIMWFQQFYPVNYLRNVAVNQSQTSHLFLSDIDFLPMPDLYNHLKSIVSRIDMEKESKVGRAFIIKKCLYMYYLWKSLIKMWYLIRFHFYFSSKMNALCLNTPGREQINDFN